jgi:hypothetical protein
VTAYSGDYDYYLEKTGAEENARAAVMARASRSSFGLETVLGGTVSSKNGLKTELQTQLRQPPSASTIRPPLCLDLRRLA